ncbi:MAG: class I SAM-dependent methyltransferase [Deltaproteobacteria bacterium]|nr:class I SAM-dependent methyltransferase [Deltaproteobacteria bacterium]
MSENHTKNEDYILPDSDDESKRLERQARLYGAAAFIDPCLTPDVCAVAELGCGSGYFTNYAAGSLSNAMVVGLDIDSKRIEFAKGLYTAPNLSFKVGDLTDLPFDANTFDLVFTRFVLVHYPDPAEALKEMIRVVRPGGTIVAYDMIHSGVWFSPAKPAFQRVLKAAMDVMRERGMEPDQGLHLPVAFKRAGLKNMKSEIVPHSSMTPDPLFEDYLDNWAKTIEGICEILATGFDQDIVEKACAELLPSKEPTFLVEITVLVSGEVA